MSAPATSSSAMPVQPGLDGQLGAVLLGGQPDRRRLDPQRQVLRHERDVARPRGEVARDGEDARVVASRRGSPAGSTAGSVWSSSTRSTPPLVELERLVEPAVLDAQVVEQPQRLARVVAELGMRAFGLELGDRRRPGGRPRARRSGAALAGRTAARWCRGRRCGARPTQASPVTSRDDRRTRPAATTDARRGG